MYERSVLPKFYTYSVEERLRILLERGIIAESDYRALQANHNVLSKNAADGLIENVIGIFGLPMGLGLNFKVNQKDYVVPMVVEEPSILAAVSAAAKTVRQAGGFETFSDESLLIGQVQLVGLSHPAKAQSVIQQHRQEIIDLANSLHPNMISRGGGVRQIETHLHARASGESDMLVVHLLVDTCDAMGANLVNTMCEGVAPLIEKLTGGRVFLRILSNLTDRSIVRSTCRIPVELLANKGQGGEEVRDAIVVASEFASLDPYRATTHNKGIMNGIDSLALASGNDWRAIEAAAHAYAGRGKGYTSLSKWSVGEGGALEGVIELPIKVGIVGGSLKSNPSVALAQRILQVESAGELAGLMAAVGLAQNFSALKALGTEGIQRGHMTLHARSCAIAAGATEENFDLVVEEMLACGEIKEWKAREVLENLKGAPKITNGKLPAHRNQERFTAEACGKVILLGEHAAVYGSHVIAAPVMPAIEATVAPCEESVRLLIPRWGVEETIDTDQDGGNAVRACVKHIIQSLDLVGCPMSIEIKPHIPRAMGLGASASMAVATIRAIAGFWQVEMDDDAVNSLAFQCEGIAHGTPSGIDNTLATFGQFSLFRKGSPNLLKPLSTNRPISLVLGLSNSEGLTARMVSQVKQGREHNPKRYDRLFDEIDSLTLEGALAVERGDLEQLGRLMNVCQGLLNALGVSTWELEELIGLARQHGALGAKLTGSGGGGAMIALCPPSSPDVAEKMVKAMRMAGYRAMTVDIEPTDGGMPRT